MTVRRIPLENVLKEVVRPVELATGVSYRSVGVKWYGAGVHVHEERQGHEFDAARFQIRSDDVIYNDMWARKGSVAVVPAALSGAVASSHFPTFEIDTAAALPKYLSWYFRTGDFWNECELASQGSTGRNQIKRRTFLAIRVPLPPVSEQRRIVERIEGIAGRVDEARRLRGEVDAGADDLMIAMAHRRDLPDDVKQARGWVRRKLGECMQLSEEPVKVAVSESYPNLGIYSFGRGLFAKAPITGFETSASRLFRVKTNQFIYSRLFAFEGAYGVVGEEFDGCFVSNEYPTFDCRPDVMRPEFLAAYFRTPTVWRAVATGSKGLGDRRQRVHPEQVLNHELWVPPLAYQDTLAKMSRQRVSSRRPADECSVAMNAVLPAVLDKAFRGEM